MKPDRLIDVAAAVSDGAAVDWTRVESESDQADRHLVDHLRLLEQIASVHAGLPPVASFELSLKDSLLDHMADPDATAGAPARWGPLTIIERIGSGTYADVYRARDPRLDRPVALKLLRHLEAGSDALESETIEEARLLARVRHPNVVTVYGAERIDGRVGIWMEFVDGRTLEQELREHGQFPAEELIAVGSALCRALGAVHQAGLLHRDVKAQNVMRDRDDRILLTDFGTGREVTDVGTAGELAGTPLYLAPEMLKGAPASVSSDVYSLGVLLYHLATGSFPVSGRSLRDLSDAHARGAHVPLREVRPDLPERLAAAIDRAAASDVAQRYESVRALETALTGTAGSRAFDRRARLATVALLMTLALVLLGYVVLHQPARSQTGSMTFKLESLTFAGDVTLGVVSRTGHLAAYVRNQALWLHLSNGSDVQLVGPEPGRLFLSLTIEPNDTFVDFLSRTGTPPTDDLWRAPLTGLPIQKIAGNVESGIGWSPDGRRMAFVRRASGAKPHTELVIAETDSQHPWTLGHSTAGNFLISHQIDRGVNRPVWSPDGTTVALLMMKSNQIALIDSATGELRRNITVGATILTGLAWLDNARLLVNQHAVQLAPSEVWIVDVRTSQSTPLVADTSDYTDVSTTADGQTAASTKTERRAGVWVGGPGGESMTAWTTEFSAGATRWLSLDNHGDLAIATQLGDERLIRVARSPGTSLTQITAHGQHPTLAPNGAALVFTEDGENAGLYRADLDGTRATRLVEGDAQALWITADSRMVFFISSRSGVQSTWSVPLAGGTPREVIHRLTSRIPLVSPDGRRLFVSSKDAEDRPVVLVCDLPSCVNVRELRLPLFDQTSGAPWQMAPDGMGVGIVTRDDPTNIWLQPLDGSPPRQLTHFTDRRIASFGWSPDGKRLALTRAINPSDIVLFKRLKEK